MRQFQSCFDSWRNSPDEVEMMAELEGLRDDYPGVVKMVGYDTDLALPYFVFQNSDVYILANDFPAVQHQVDDCESWNARAKRIVGHLDPTIGGYRIVHIGPAISYITCGDDRGFLARFAEIRDTR